MIVLTSDIGRRCTHDECEKYAFTGEYIYFTDPNTQQPIPVPERRPIIPYRFNSKSAYKSIKQSDIILRFESGWKTATKYSGCKIFARDSRKNIIIFTYIDVIGSQFDYDEEMVQYRKDKIARILENLD